MFRAVQKRRERRLASVVATITVLALGGGVLLGRVSAEPGGERAEGVRADEGRVPSTTEPPRPANPVLNVDFPDPHVSRMEDGGFIAFATNSGALNLQASTSPDGTTWSPPFEALPDLPHWARPERPDLWAPAHVASSSEHLVFFAVRGARSGRHCIGSARSASATGPYVPDREPLVCMANEGGSIDPSVFRGNDGDFLLWKTDGNCCGLPSVLWSQPIDLAAGALSGSPVKLLENDAEWEGGIIEAPELVLIDGRLLLFYSGGRYADGTYGIGAARCDTPSGPCQRLQSHPVLSSTARTVGPGGQSIVNFDGDPWVYYHAWSSEAVGYGQGGQRSLRMDPLRMLDDSVIVLGPTVG